MFDKAKHQLLMGQILKDIYGEVSIASFLGFKGGTCVYFFYGLPRFSVDLDFDLLQTDSETKKIVFEKIELILANYGQVKESYLKKNTIFFLLSYGQEDRNIKIEISIRETPFQVRESYELKEYLGIAMLTAKQDYLFAGKLIALTTRKDVAMRDVYDIYFFAKNRWPINEEVINFWAKKSLKNYLAVCIGLIESIESNEILKELGEMISEKEKKWVKDGLKKETVFSLKNYLSVLR